MTQVAEAGVATRLLPVRPPETVSMRTRDGVRLEADVHRPDGAGSWPVLLMRVAGGRRAAFARHFAHPRWYAAHGYVVVVQDVRGTGGSEGRFHPFTAEAEDGADAVAWAALLPGSAGVVGTFGCGYAGMAQRLALTAAPPALKAAVPAFSGADVYTDWAYEGGAFRLDDAMRCALRMAAESARRVEDGAAHRALLEAANAACLNDEIPARPKPLRDYARYSHYDDWLTTPAFTPYWDALSAGNARSTAAVLTVAGWFNPRLAGDVDAHRHHADGGAAAALVVGPWSGARWDHTESGAAAMPDMDRLHLAWFDRHLKGLDNDAPVAVSLFDILSGRWHAFENWPSAAAATLHLASDGRAARRLDDGVLRAIPGEPALDAVVHDPRDPAPAVGWHGTVDAGLCDRAAADARPDVAVYTAAPLTRPLALAGQVALDLWVEADAPSFDVAAVLSAVLPDGRVLNLTQGYVRVDPGLSTRPLTVDLRAVCATLQPGSSLRLSLAGACHPAYPVNPGTGAEPAESRLVDALPITLLVHSGRDRPSRLHLPVAPA